MRVLITGITGFVGSHLAEYALTQEGVEVYGTVRWRSRLDNVEHLLDRIKLVDCDLRDGVAVRRTLEEVKPDYIFHLAAQSFVPTSWKAPAETFITNVISQLHILEAIRELGLRDTRVHVAGSSEEYGMVYEHETPITEENPLRPLSPYAVSKVAQDLLAYQYHQSYGIYTVRTRAFNHTGPRRGHVFVESDFTRQVALIEKGKKEPVIEVGNLEARRDFSDVRDIVRGYWLSLEMGEPGEVYNLGSGKAITIRELLDLILSFTDIEIEIRQVPERMRPSDVMLLVADYTKFHKATGWEPTIPLERTIEDLLNYWRERV